MEGNNDRRTMIIFYPYWLMQKRKQMIGRERKEGFLSPSLAKGIRQIFGRQGF
jgi:hypothetical protein